jgi:hypothetical protein|tara:strand:+ start:3228 stop:4751 length:1524 start_codon:yes stop_codon:yes gene_type:complete
MSLAEDFATRFAGLRHAYGTFTATNELREDGKASGKNITISKELSDKDLLELWENHLAGEQSVGIVPIDESNCCLWGAIDVDEYQLDLKGLAKKLAKHKLPLVVCRSKSGGAHIYVFIAEPVPASLLQRKLRQLAASIGYGQAEIFPKQTQLLLERGDRGSTLNMPYFGGENSTRYAYGTGGEALTPTEFLERATKITLTASALEKLEASPLTEAVDWLDQGPPCIQHLVVQGFPKGTRNSGLFNVGVFLRKKYPDDWEKRLEDVNMKYMQPPLGAQEVLTIGKQLKRKDYFYRCNDQPIASHCNSPLCRTRKHGIGANGGTPLFSNLTKQDSEPPIWFLDVEGGRLELETDDLLNQNRFQRKCMDALNKIPPKVKENVWRQIIQQLLDSLTIVEVPKESSTEGHFLELLENFCTERPARERDELLLHKPWTDAGKTYFRLGDLMEHLHRNNFKEYQRNKLTSKLKQLHGEPFFFNIKGRGVNVWFIEEFQSQDEPHDLPDFDDNPL